MWSPWLPHSKSIPHPDIQKEPLLSLVFSLPYIFSLYTHLSTNDDQHCFVCSYTWYKREMPPFNPQVVFSLEIIHAHSSSSGSLPLQPT